MKAPWQQQPDYQGHACAFAHSAPYRAFVLTRRLLLRGTLLILCVERDRASQLHKGDGSFYLEVSKFLFIRQVQDSSHRRISFQTSNRRLQFMSLNGFRFGAHSFQPFFFPFGPFRADCGLCVSRHTDPNVSDRTDGRRTTSANRR